jgi:CBS domain-containing protein
MRERPPSQNIVVEDVIDFLRKIPPFQFLETQVLGELASRISLAYYPAGTVMLEQDGPPSSSLFVIKKGGAKVAVRALDNAENLVDYRSAGDLIGFASLTADDRSRTTVTVTQDTICYVIGREDFLSLLEANPQVREYLHRSFLRRYLDKTIHEMRARRIFSGGGERLLFTTPVGALATSEAVAAPATVSTQAAAALMSSRRISSLVLLDAAGSPVGIITDRDIRDRVVAAGRPLGEPVANVMKRDLVTAESRDYCFEALLSMIQHGIHHLLVTENGRLRGIVTNHDLMILQGTSPLSVAREIEHQQDIAGLAAVSRKLDRVVGLLLKEGATAGGILRVVGEMNDHIVRRALEIGLRAIGPAPVAWAWLGLGSEGRREQVFRTDQDNALIYEEPPAGRDGEKARSWAAAFASFAGEALLACGFPPCPAGIMASNPAWRQPLGAWRRLYAEWIRNPAGDGLMKSAIFLDFRVITGDAYLGESLRDHIVSLLADQRVFFNFLVNAVVRNRPPIGFFGSFTVEKNGEHKDHFNLKARGINPLLDLVRFLSLERGIRETATVARIAALRERRALAASDAEELLQAFDFLLLLRLHHQFRQLSEGLPLDNFIDPRQLTHLEKRTLKEAFHVIARLQGHILERYRVAVL